MDSDWECGESKNQVQKGVRHPGIEPGSIAWEATMLTTTPIALRHAAVCFAPARAICTWQKDLPSTGLEPAIFGSGNQRLIH